MAGGSHQGGAIKPIDKAAVHRICSGQVVLDLATAVKELVENSLDAGARNIDIRLKEYGSELIEVADNGCGVAPENHAGLALKYHTSKISTFSDLTSLATFGFRGEALSSLCALADVTITTRTAAEPVATELVFDRNGRVASSRKVARAVGTTVAVGKLFSPLPVRHREFTRNVKREYGKLLTLLQAYALISTDVRLICTNQAGSAGRSTVIQTQGGRSVRDNIVTVFGTKFASSLEPIEVAIGDSHKVTGFVSKAGAGCGRASGDRQFLFVNGRPVEMPKVGKLLNETYRAFNSLQYPMAVLNFVLPTDSYDVNVTPDKRKIFLHTEADLLSALRTSLEQLYAPDKYVFRVQESQPAKEKGGAKAGKKRTLSVGGDEDESAESSDSEEEGGDEESENESEENMGEKGRGARRETGDAKKRKRSLSVGLEEDGSEEDGDIRDAEKRSSRDGRGSGEMEEEGTRGKGKNGTKRSLEAFSAGGEANGGEPSQGARKRRALSPGVEEQTGDETNGGVTRKMRSLADALEEEEGEDEEAGSESAEEIGGRNGTRSRRNKDRRDAEDDEEGSGAEVPSGEETRKGARASPQSEPPRNESEDEQEDTPQERTEPERGAGTRSAHFGRVRSAARTPVPLDAFLNVPAAGKAAPEKAAHAPWGIPQSGNGGSLAAETAPGKKPRQASLSGFLVRGKPSAGPPDVRRAADTCPDLRDSEDSDGVGSADGSPDESAKSERTGTALVRNKRGRSGGAEAGSAEPPAGERIPTATAAPERGGLEVLEDEVEHDVGASRRDSLGETAAQTPGSDVRKAPRNLRPPSADVRPNLSGGRTTIPDVGASLPDASPLPTDASTPSPDVRTDSPREAPSDDMRVAFDVGRLRQRWANWRAEQLETGRERKRGRQFAAASLGRAEAGDLDAATNELERVFNKKDFGKMDVCGQFNLGFIIARLDNDLFIVDQHASDEKFNFERLVRTTVLNKQPLLNPLGLDLTAAEEVTCQEHLQAFRRNGFELVEARDAPAGRRFKLAAVPFSKNITFGPDDVHELVSLLADAPIEAADSPGGSSPANAVRPSRVRTMLASRACRSSIMIGDPLNKQQMVKILRHLEGLDAPWNCPHGRPTMRHLVDLATLKL